jgi:hypothetical protein
MPSRQYAGMPDGLRHKKCEGKNMTYWKQLRKGGYVLAATLILAGMSMGKTRTYDRNLSQEATNLLNSVRTDAQQVQTDTSKLQNLSKDDWRANVNEWNQIQRQVNDMSSKVSRLEAISSSVRPRQRKTIINTTGMVRLMAVYTKDATNYLDSHHDNFFNHNYRNYEKDMSKEARKISRSVSKLEEHTQKSA